jgi:AcrR family transcriptional regulator
LNVFKIEFFQGEAMKTKKSNLTRRKLLDVSLKLFLEKGFEETTMRDIGTAAGLAPAAAYYHVKSKQELVFDLYERTYQDHLPDAERILQDAKDLPARLAGLIKAHLAVSEPFWEISRVLMKTASTPGHPLSPFSNKSKPLRDANIALLGRALDGPIKLNPSLRQELPGLLWMYKMAMLFYWLHDESASRKKSYALADRSAVLVARLIKLSDLPVLRGFALDAIRTFNEFKIFQ